MSFLCRTQVLPFYFSVIHVSCPTTFKPSYSIGMWDVYRIRFSIFLIFRSLLSFFALCEKVEVSYTPEPDTQLCFKKTRERLIEVLGAEIGNGFKAFAYLDVKDCMFSHCTRKQQI